MEVTKLFSCRQILILVFLSIIILQVKFLTVLKYPTVQEREYFVLGPLRMCCLKKKKVLLHLIAVEKQQNQLNIFLYLLRC